LQPADNNDDDRNPVEQSEREPIGRKFYTAMAAYGALALLAGLTLDGNFRLFVWVFLAALALKTYLSAIRKP